MTVKLTINMFYLLVEVSIVNILVHAAFYIIDEITTLVVEELTLCYG